MAPEETYEDFLRLGSGEVLERAKEAEERPREIDALRPHGDERTWRRLYRDMRRASASTVADLKITLVEEYASKLGYGYLRVRHGRRDAFMPLKRP